MKSRRKKIVPQSTAENLEAVGLTRGSTERQVITLSAQAHSIERNVEFRRWKLARIFEDRGQDGKEPFLLRPTVLEMLNYMNARGIRHIICTRLDRMFRSNGDSIITIDRLFKAGVFMIFTEHPDLDPTNPMGRAMLQMLGTFAELETNLRSQRQAEGFEEHRRLGYKSGVNVPYGWKAVPAQGGRLTKERREASDLIPAINDQIVLGDMMRRAKDGQTPGALATVLNLAGIPTAKAGQTMKRKGREIVCSGKWTEKTVISVLSYARLAHPGLSSDNSDEVEEAVAELKLKPHVA